MTGGASFLDKAARELRDLVEAERHSPLLDADAYRALVLLARLRDAPPERAGDLPALVIASLLARCVLPDPAELLVHLDVALEGDEEPGGPLLDALLDVDDLAGVLGLAGQTPRSAALVVEARQRVAARLGRVAPLASWAVMRGDALSRGAAVAHLWEDVAANNASPGSDRRVRGALAALILPDLPRVAAHTAAQGEIAIRDAVGEIGATAYVDPETAERRLDVLLPSKDMPPPRAVYLVAVRRATDERLGSEPLLFEREGRDIYVSLGPDVGSGSARHRLCARLGVDMDEVVFRIEFEDGR
jgi:hypothetical protein